MTAPTASSDESAPPAARDALAPLLFIRCGPWAMLACPTKATGCERLIAARVSNVAHTLIIPKRHVRDYFGLQQAEVNVINVLLHEQRAVLIKEDSAITDFNIGTNRGESAGQTVWHCHVHLIPRRQGDVEKPRDGVRHLIPGKGAY